MFNTSRGGLGLHAGGVALRAAFSPSSRHTGMRPALMNGVTVEEVQLLALPRAKRRFPNRRFAINSLEFWKVRCLSNRNDLADFFASPSKRRWLARRGP